MKDSPVILEKIKTIAHLKAENNDLKKNVETLERRIKHLEDALSWARNSWVGIGGFGRG